MRLPSLSAVLLITTLCAVGCHPSQSPTPISSTVPTSGRSLADMEAEYAILREAHQKKCLYAPPEQIKANQAGCEAERQAMAPLGNAIVEKEQEQARKQANP